MPILLPPDPGAYFRRFSACAHVDEPTGRMLEIIQAGDADKGAEIDLDAVQDGYAYRLRASKWTNGIGHIHFDIARRDDVSDSFEPDSDLPTVTASLEEFSGQSVCVSVRIRFHVPLNDLPENGIVGAMHGISTNLGGASLTLTGARMSLDQEPFSEIEWRIADDEDTVIVILDMEKQCTISDKYLVDLFESAVSGFNQFVLEEEQNGSRHAT